MTPTEHFKARKDQQAADNAKFLEAATLLGFQVEYFSGMFRVRHNGEYIGTMDAASWLDHLRNAMINSKRC